MDRMRIANKRKTDGIWAAHGQQMDSKWMANRRQTGQAVGKRMANGQQTDDKQTGNGLETDGKWMENR